MGVWALVVGLIVEGIGGQVAVAISSDSDSGSDPSHGQGPSHCIFCKLQNHYYF